MTQYRRLRDPVSPALQPGSQTQTHWVTELAARGWHPKILGHRLGDPVCPAQRPNIAEPETQGGEAMTQYLRLGSQCLRAGDTGGSARRYRVAHPAIPAANLLTLAANMETQGSRTDIPWQTAVQPVFSADDRGKRSCSVGARLKTQGDRQGREVRRTTPVC